MDEPIEVLTLAEAAAVLGIDRRAAESALRRAGIRSGYPRTAVEWLRDNRPGQGARTDLGPILPILDLPEAVLSRGGVRGEPAGGWCAPADHGVPVRAARPAEQESNISGPSPG